MLIHRTEIFAELRELDAGRRSAPRVGVIAGPVAAGKTEIMHYYCNYARDHFGCVVLEATGCAEERDLPLGLVAQLFEGDVVPADIRDRVAEAIAGVRAAELTDDPDAALEPAVATVAREAMRAVEHLGEQGPVILSVDDIHHGDFASLRVLLYLVRRLARGRYILMATDSPSVTPTHPYLREELVRWSCFYQVAVDLFSGAEVAEMLAGTTLPTEDGADDAPADPAAADDLVTAARQLTGGNPLLLQGLLTDLQVRPAAPTTEPAVAVARRASLRAAPVPVPVPDTEPTDAGDEADSAFPAPPAGVPALTPVGGRPAATDRDAANGTVGDIVDVLGHGEGYRAAALSLLLRLGPAVRPVAVAVAALGRYATETAVADLLDSPVEDVAGALGALEACGVFTDGGYRHPSLATAVLATVDPAERTRLHAQVAQVLNEHGADARDVAGHFVAAGAVPTPWAVDVLVDAAADAQAEDDLAAAVEYLDLAERHCPDDAQHARIAFNLARIEWRNEPALAGRRLDGLLEAMRHGLLVTSEATVVVRWLLWLGRSDDAAEAVELLLARRDISEPAAAAELLALNRWYPTRVPGRTVTVASGAEHAAPPSLRAATALHGALTGRPGDQTVAAAQQVLRDCELGEASLPTISCALQALIHADRHAEAAWWCRRLIRLAIDRHAASWEAVLAAIRADAALRQGDLPAAQKWSSYALNRISRRSWGVLIGYPLAVRLQALVGMGDLEEAAVVARQVVPEELFRTSYGLRYLHALGDFHLATGRLHAARSDVGRWSALSRQWGCDLPTREPWRLTQAWVELALDRTEPARQLAVEQLNRPGGHNPRVRGQALRVIAASGDLRKRPAVLRESVDLLQEAGDREQLALAMADLAQAHTELGDYNRARLMSRRSLEVAQECGSTRVCRSRLGHAAPAAEPGTPEVSDLRQQAVEKLSSAERRVAELAVLGHTNREISAKLFITVSTVEQHLTRIYRKIGVTRRADLPLRLPAAGRPSTTFAPTAPTAVNG